MTSKLETKLRHRFRIIRFLDNMLLSSDCELTCDLHIDPAINPEKVHLHLNAMKMWLDKFVDGCVIYNPKNDIDMSWVHSLENITLMTPGEPRDHVLLTVLHAKLTSIASPAVAILRTEFQSDTGFGFAAALSGPCDEWLPSVDEWLGQHRYMDQAWWNRDDASTLDVFAGPDADITNPPDFGDRIVNMFREDDEDEDSSNEPRSAEIIKPSFKLKVVDEDDRA
jgi:hypothetical protein